MLLQKKNISLCAAVICAMSIASPAMADQIRVAWYGGSWGDAFQKCIADPFTEETGINVVPVIGTSNTTLAKLRQQQDEPIIDVAVLDGGVSEMADAGGLLRPLTAEAIPNLDNLKEPALYQNDQGQNYAASIGYYSLGIVYNKEAVSQVPDSWDDLWNDEYAYLVTIPSPANSAGIPFVVFLAHIRGHSLDDLGPVYERLAQLDVSSYFNSSGSASNAFQSGAAIIGAHFSVAAWSLADKGLPIGFVVPKEGVWATDARAHLIKGAPSPDAAEKFVNQALSVESSTCLANTLYLGPAVKGVTIQQGVAEKMPWGKEGDISDLYLLDWKKVNQLRGEITKNWNRRVVH